MPINAKYTPDLGWWYQDCRSARFKNDDIEVLIEYVIDDGMAQAISTRIKILDKPKVDKESGRELCP